MPTGSLVMFTILQKRVQFDIQLCLKRWRCSANDVLMPETLHLLLRNTHQENENPSAADVNSIDFVKFKQGFKNLFQGITTLLLIFLSCSLQDTWQHLQLCYFHYIKPQP